MPLNNVPTIKHKAPKPGYLIDEYIRVQSINSALRESKNELKVIFNNIRVQEAIFEVLDKWLKINK